MKRKIINVALLALLGTSMTSQAALSDLGNGLIYDTDLNITWLSDANYSKTSGYSATGIMNWYDATTWAGQLTYQGHSDWRLPTVDEMDHLFYRELGGVANNSISDLHNPHYALFSNMQDAPYWSNTEKVSNPDNALGYVFGNRYYGGGYSFEEGKTHGHYAMAVLPAVPEPETYAMMLGGLGLLGWRLRRRSN